MNYSSRTKRKRKRLTKSQKAKSNKPPARSLRQEAVAGAFLDMVTRKKPRFYQNWSKEIREKYFNISARVTDNGCRTSITITWLFLDTKRYCCTSPMCFIGRKQSPATKEWWQAFRKALKDRGFTDELSPMYMCVEVAIPEVEVEDSPDRFSLTCSAHRVFEWHEK